MKVTSFRRAARAIMEARRGAIPPALPVHRGMTVNRRLHRLPRAVAAALAVLCLTVLLARAQPPAPPDRHQALEQQPPPAWPDEAAPRAASAPLWPWARMVYQSAQYSDNWEIVISNDDGSAPVRLTYHPAADISPSLVRGGDRIAFASNRDGEDLELYVMNADGSGLRQLTFNNTDDSRPVWSPDGKRIAFQAWRWGRPEIFVINADGSGEQRLTDHDSYDGDVTWSPDGAQIAFCSYRDGEVPAIFVMPSTGGPATRISTIENSCDPVWSPDGGRIAFDASPGPSIFFALWVMNADGSAPRLITDFGAATGDAWPHSWSPDGCYIAYSYMVYTLYYGQWYLTATHASAVPVDEPYSHPTPLTSSNRVMWPSLATLDVTPPAVAFAPLPEFSRAAGYGLDWSATDAGGAGVRSYDVETRPNAGAPWTPLLTAAAQTSVLRSGPPGRVEYRIRARDWAFNTSPWPTGYSTFTRLFAAQLTGRITDNRGVGLAAVTPAIEPWTLSNEAAGDGRYLARLSALGNQTVTLARPGYGYVPPTTRPVYVDAVQDFYLPPANNLIRNPHFEAAAGALDQWTAGGTLLVAAVSDQVSTGDRAVALGLPCQQPCLADQGELQSEYEEPLLAIDSRGGRHLTYKGADGGYYRYRPPRGDWTAPASLPDGFVPRALAFDAADTLYAVYGREPHAVCLHRKPAGGAWSACELIPGAQASDLALQVDAAGGVHVMAYGVYYRRELTGDWHPIAWPYNRVTGQAMTVDAAGTAHFVLRVSGAWDYPRTLDRLVHRTVVAAGLWGEETVLLTAPTFDDSLPEPQSLIADPFGRLHVFTDDIYVDLNLAHAMRRLDGSWTPLVPLAHTTGNYIAATAGSDGRVHLIYQDTSGTIHRSMLPGLAWSAPSNLGSNVGWFRTPELVVGPDDSLQFVTVSVGDNSLYLGYFGPAPAGQSGAATLSQTVAVPAGMSHPTLSFMKRVLGNVEGGSVVAVRVRDGANAAQEFPINGDAGWSLGWVDLSPWRGKAVTVAFVVEQASDAPAARLFLDSVTLGPAAPQLWLALTAPVQATPGGEFAATLRFGNAGSVAAAQTTLTLTLPDGLAFVAATPPPASTNPLRWAPGDLAAGMGDGQIELTLAAAADATTGAPLTLRAHVASATPEAETADNEARQPVFIGWKGFLPGVMGQ